MNGHNTQRIVGWNLGFGGGLWQGSCSGYYWLDTNHMLLYPATGQTSGPDGYFAGINVVPQPVIINIESGATWLPPVNTSSRPTCNRVYWSQELGVLITSETNNDISTVSTYTYDGYRLASYPGSLWDVSPSGKKIFVSDNQIIDLETNKKINLNWSLEDYQEQILSDLFWASDETRIYRCCYFYADLITGTSHRFERSDFHFTNGDHLDSSGLWFYNDYWVRDDKYFLVWWQAVTDGDIKYLPMFDPAEKIFYDVREMAGIPEDWTSLYYPVSPDGEYVWMEGWNGSYLINLATFESQYFSYANISYSEIDWSSDSKFVWFEVYDSVNENTEFQIFSIADKKLNHLPVAPLPESGHWWHPTDNIVVYPAKDKNSLIFLDASTMSYRELSFKNQETQYKFGNLVWSPYGEKITFVTENSVLWQVDYPSLENLENIMSSIFTINNVNWSPDGTSIAFTNGADIYIVETVK